MQKSQFTRSKPHRQYVSQFRCVACSDGLLVWEGFPVSQAAHLRPYAPCGTGLKPSDAMVVPLCPNCHDEFDGRTKGAQGKRFWELRGIDPVEIAAKLMEGRNGNV